MSAWKCRHRPRLSRPSSTTCATAARSRCSASSRRQFAIDWDKVIFNMLTIKGIYGREMYETWYKMTVMIQTGLDISPVITHRFAYTEFERASRR